MDGRFRGRRLASGRQLAQRQSRVTEAEQTDLLQAVGQALEGAVALQRSNRFELLLGGAAGADEVRVVGVREPVCLAASGDAAARRAFLLRANR